MKEEFKQIAAYEADDFAAAWQRVTSSIELQQLAQSLGFNPQQLPAIQTGEQLDQSVIMPLVEKIIRGTSKGAELRGTLAQNGLLLTNHRDIILDSAILATLLFQHQHERIYIGIGTNLYVRPWIEDVVRLCKAFSVIRGGNVREVMHNSARLSEYIHELIAIRGKSAWLAQREGRAKDSDDRTQPALLKMLTMAGEGDVLDRLRALNITPVALSYEYDPCDWLKAREFQLKRDNADYKKTQEEDYLNMQTGIQGYKGRIVFTITPSINPELEQIREQTAVRNEQINLAAALIDRHIHAHYEIFNVNRIAYDLLTDEQRFAQDYTVAEKEQFEAYLQGQLSKIDIPNKDEAYLRHKLLEMYANPFRNQLQTQL